jgi:hypothetical protein
MSEQHKAQAYGELLNEHTRVGNRINEIKGQNIELSKEQQRQVELLQKKQIEIMENIKRLFN